MIAKKLKLGNREFALIAQWYYSVKGNREQGTGNSVGYVSGRYSNGLI